MLHTTDHSYPSLYVTHAIGFFLWISPELFIYKQIHAHIYTLETCISFFSFYTNNGIVYLLFCTLLFVPIILHPVFTPIFEEFSTSVHKVSPFFPTRCIVFHCMAIHHYFSFSSLMIFLNMSFCINIYVLSL